MVLQLPGGTNTARHQDCTVQDTTLQYSVGHNTTVQCWKQHYSTMLYTTLQHSVVHNTTVQSLQCTQLI